MQSDIYAFMCTTLQEAGTLLLKHFRNPTLRVDAKGPSDLVTEADHASEAVLTAAIRTHFPDDAILAEEAGPSGPAASRLWVIDPLEATYNFARGLPLWGINLALVEQGVPTHAAFFDPLLRELYFAERGQGAWLNGQAIRTSGATEPAGTTIYCSTIPNVQRLAGKVKRLRVIGSIGNALAYVAAGYLDAAVEMSGGPWDYVVGRLLIEEAGGVVSAADGRPLILESTTVLAAASPELHNTLRYLIEASPSTSS